MSATSRGGAELCAALEARRGPPLRRRSGPPPGLDSAAVPDFKAPTSSTATTTAGSPSGARLRAIAEPRADERGGGLRGRRVHTRREGQRLSAMTFAIGRRFVIADGVERWKEAEASPSPPRSRARPGDADRASSREEGRDKVPTTMLEAVKAADGQIAEESNLKPRAPALGRGHAAKSSGWRSTTAGPARSSPRSATAAAAAARARQGLRSSTSAEPDGRRGDPGVLRDLRRAQGVDARRRGRRGRPRAATRCSSCASRRRLLGLLYNMVRPLRDALAIAEALAAGQACVPDQEGPADARLRRRPADRRRPSAATSRPAATRSS